MVEAATVAVVATEVAVEAVVADMVSRNYKDIGWDCNDIGWDYNDISP